MTNNTSETNKVENTHPLFELKGIEEMNIPEQDRLLSLSPEAQVTLMKLGVAWQETTGFQSWVDSEVILALIKIPDETWTINRLSKWSGYGRAGIENSLIIFMKRVGVIIEDRSGRFIKYNLTLHGREALEAMLYNCWSCHNARKCDHCETGVAITNRWGSRRMDTPGGECEHILTKDCDECSGTGLVECHGCNGNGKRQNYVGDDEPQDCWTCTGEGHPKGRGECHNCTDNCSQCLDNTRVRKCDWCRGDMKCVACKKIIKLITYNVETTDDDI